MKKSLSCPLCLSDSKFYFDAKDENRKIDSKSFEYRKCNYCETIFLSDIPEDLGRYYSDEYYEIPSRKKLEILAKKNLGKLRITKKYKKSGDLLEIGSAFGIFALQAKRSGFRVKSIEMNQKCCNFLREIIGVDVVHSSEPIETIKSLDGSDVIVAWHVLEHLDDPRDFIKTAAANLKNDGILILATPNPKAFQFELMGKHWPHLDAPRHISLMPKEAIEVLALESGLQCMGVEINDGDGLMWNAFGWQRILMNQCNSRPAKLFLFIVGYVLSLLASPIERRNFRGSAYTIIFKKI
jgi:2-polyprenyl-3-methyl-5-hydroxy-6-metoxy-1,4-benzoquinol methylase